MTQPLNTHYRIKHAFSLQSLEHVIIQKTYIYSATKNMHNIKESTILDKAWRSEKHFPRQRVISKIKPRSEPFFQWLALLFVIHLLHGFFAGFRVRHSTSLLRIHPVAPRRLTMSHSPSSFRMGRVVFLLSSATLGADVSFHAYTDVFFSVRHHAGSIMI